MDRYKTVALLLAGVMAGVGGKAVVESALSPAAAQAQVPFVHAVDLRNDPTRPDAGITATVYGNIGEKDIGQPQGCNEVPEPCARCMQALALTCHWL